MIWVVMVIAAGSLITILGFLLGAGARLAGVCA